MPKIKKALPYLLILLDIFALLSLQNFVECTGTTACKDNPSLFIIIIALLATGFYFYKRHKAKLPFLPSFFSLKYGKDSASKTVTPLKNRIFFAFCYFMMTMSYLVSVYHYAKGSDTPPYAHWAVYTLPLLIGLGLITLKDEIKLRLHPFWTPFGLLYTAFAWGLVIFDGLPQGAALGYSLFNSIGEGFWFATGFGLMLAFVGLRPMYKRAFYFFGLAFFGGFFGTIELSRQIQGILAQKPIEWGAFLDMTWLAGGYFVLFLMMKRLIKDCPPIKIMAKAVGFFILLIVLNTIVSQNFISKAFPKNSWQHHWLKGYMPAYGFQCAGVDCPNIVYREPYSFCVNGNGINRGNPTSFYDVAQSRVTKECRYELNSDIESLKVVCTHPIAGANAESVDLPVVECGNARFEGAYGEGFGGIGSMQKELYSQ